MTSEKKPNTRRKALRIFHLAFFSLCLLGMVIILWPDHYSRIKYEEITNEYADFVVSVSASARDFNSAPIDLRLNVTSEYMTYFSGKVISRKLTPSGYRVGNNGDYLEFFYNDKNKSKSTASINYSIKTDIPMTYNMSTKPINYVDSKKTDRLPIVLYEFLFKLCKKGNECSKYEIEGELKHTREEGYKFYSPLELFNGFGVIFIGIPLLLFYLFTILLIMFSTRPKT